MRFKETFLVQVNVMHGIHYSKEAEQTLVTKETKTNTVLTDDQMLVQKKHHLSLTVRFSCIVQYLPRF